MPLCHFQLHLFSSLWSGCSGSALWYTQAICSYTESSSYLTDMPHFVYIFKKITFLLLKVLCKMPSTPEMAFLLVCEGHFSVPSLLGCLGANRLFPFLAQSLYIHYILVTALSDVTIRNSTQTGLGNTWNILKNPGEDHTSRRAGSRYSNSALRNLPPLSLSLFSFSLFHTHTQTHVHTNINTQVYEITNMFEATRHMEERAFEAGVNSCSAPQSIHPGTKQGSYKGWEII